MKTASQMCWFWAPRILCLLFAVFISLFALDVFDGHSGFWHTLRALLIHLIPTGILLLILAVSWRWDWFGGFLFPALGAFYIFSFGGRVHWSAQVLIAGPLFLLGALFVMSWLTRRALPTGN